jgi:hypothetical protein
MWCQIGDASLFALATIHGKTPSSIRSDLPVLYPATQYPNTFPNDPSANLLAGFASYK